MNKLELTAIIVCLAAIGVLAQTATIHEYLPVHNSNIKNGWTLVHEDEFNSFNVNDWYSNRTVEGFHDAHYTLNNATVNSGKLILTAKKEITVVNNATHNMTIGEVWSSFDIGNTHPTGKFKYGYVEIKAKLARGKGMHSSFWLYGSNWLTGEGHEIDIFEAGHWGRQLNQKYPVKDKGNIGNQPIQTFNTNVHRFYDSNNDNKLDDHLYGHSYALAHIDENLLSETFNTYAVKWTPHEITWYFNNREFRSIKTDELKNNSDLGIDINQLNKMRIILALDYDNRLENSSPYESTMEVEYVRVYKKANDAYIDIPYIEDSGNNILKNQVRVCHNSATFHVNNVNGYNLEWSVDDGGSIISQSTTNPLVEVEFEPGKHTMNLKLKVSNGTIEDERNITITSRLDAYFFFEEYKCTGSSSSSLSVKTNNHSSGTDHTWILHECDENGVVPNNSPILQIGWGSNFTFTGLFPNKYYRVKHGVWKDGCNYWAESHRIFKTKLHSSFSVDIATSPGNYTIITKPHQNAIRPQPQNLGHSWTLYLSNQWGGINGAPLAISNLEEATFPNHTFVYGEYYRIEHGVWSGCDNWSGSNRVIYLDNPNSSSLRISSVDNNTEENNQVRNSVVYPNPNNGIFNVNITELNNINIKVINSLGRVIIQKDRNSINPTRFDIQDQPSGIYFIQITSGENNLKTEKIVKF